MPISVMIEEKLIQFAILKTEDLRRRRRRYDRMKNQKREEGFGVKKAGESMCVNQPGVKRFRY